VAGWFAYKIFFSGGPVSQTVQEQSPTVAAPAATTTPNQPAANQGSVPIFNLGGSTTTGTSTGATSAP
jgi:hypothetical protein